MITPRRTRLVRVPELQTFREVIRSLPRESGERAVLVPSRSAARQLAESGLLPASDLLLTRDELYQLLQSRLPGAPRLLTPFERDNIMQAAAGAVEEPPFPVRPGLVAEMLRFYDQLRRQSQSVLRFRELMMTALGSGAEQDRGTERLLRQTAFLAEAFERYEQRVSISGGCDEHALRELVLSSGAVTIEHVLVSIADWIADPDGLFVGDFDLLSRAPGLQTIDIVCTEPVLGAGFHERLHHWWPGLEECDGRQLLGGSSRVRQPRIAAPPTASSDEPWFVYRDREEEVLAVASRLRAAAAEGAEALGSASPRRRAALVFKRPLPYLYLAPDTLGLRGVPFQASDALPLAAEPAVAVVDLVLEGVETNFSRPAIVALLRTPHLDVMRGADRASSIAALDRALSEQRYLGDLSKLEALDAVPAAARDALEAALRVGSELTRLLEPGLASQHLGFLRTFLDRHFPPLEKDDPLAARDSRARGALLKTLDDMAAAHAAHYDPVWTIEETAAAVRRWIGEQTFLPESSPQGVNLLNDQAARYLDCEELTLVGMVEHEWPERPKRNIFYPGSLLKALGWPSEKDRRAGAEARFLDLLASPSQRVALSTFTLDDETLVGRSMLLDEVPRARLSVAAEPIGGDASADDEHSSDSDWAQLRRSRSLPDAAMFHGNPGPLGRRTWSVSALETYLDCPFKFFAQHVLRLKEDPDEEEVMDPRRQGQFVHHVFETFFREWQAAGRCGVTPENIGDARARFAEVVETALAALPNAEAGLERTRLLGSPAAVGLGEAVLRMEAERPTAVVERLLEHTLDGELVINTAAGPRRVAIRGKADRLDLLADGTFRLIDYKLGWPPKRRLQLPIYGLRAEQQLLAGRKQQWTLGEAVYLAFKGPKRVVPLFASADDRDEVLAEAQQRMAETLDAIDRGEFPPAPDDVYRCETCSYASVCRKDYVGDV